MAKLRPGTAVFVAAAAYLLLRAPDPLLLLESNDQGYQMALGMALASGRLPCLDGVTQYGPLVTVSSWLGFVLSGSAIGELCIDALGYAAAITLAWQILSRQGHTTLATPTAVVLLLLFPRFYKWYFWLLPLLGVSMAQRFRAALAAKRRVGAILSLWGALVGVAWLFRYDLGLEGMVFGLLAIIAARWSVAPGRTLCLHDAYRDGIWFLSMCAMLPGALLGLIGWARGYGNLVLFMRSIRDGAVDTVQVYGIRPFAFDPAAPVSAAGVLALLQVAFIVVYGGALGIALRELGSCREPRRAAGFGLLCVGLAGLGVLPQALHRADLQHLLQVAPPFVLVLAGLSARLAERWIEISWPGRWLAIAGYTITVSLLVAVIPEASIDLGPAWRDPVRYWRSIADLPASQHDEPVADMAMAIRQLTPSGASVFLVMATSRMPLLFFARRYQAGLFPVYEAGLFSGCIWRAANRIALSEAPPDYLVVPAPGSNEGLGEPAPFMPDLTAVWLRRYTKELHVNARYRLLARCDDDSAVGSERPDDEPGRTCG